MLMRPTKLPSLELNLIDAAALIVTPEKGTGMSDSNRAQNSFCQLDLGRHGSRPTWRRRLFTVSCRRRRCDRYFVPSLIFHVRDFILAVPPAASQ
jgi:hypothetical protein